MIFNISSSTNNLNYKIICSLTQPPLNDNTIWIKTSNFSSISFLNSLPSSGEENEVIIIFKSSNESIDTAINILKNGIFFIDIINICQYQNGIWESIESYIIKNNTLNLIENSLILMENGTIYNSNIIPIIYYNSRLDNTGIYSYAIMAGGIYTNVIIPQSYAQLHFSLKSDSNTALQYGQNYITGTLPTIISTGAGRFSYQGSTVGSSLTNITITLNYGYGFFIGYTSGSAYTITKIWLTK